MKNNNEKDLLEFINEDNRAFLDKYLLNLTDEELSRFLDENPDFLEELANE